MSDKDREAGALIGDIIKTALDERDRGIRNELKQDPPVVHVNAFKKGDAESIGKAMSDALVEIMDKDQPEPLDISPVIEAIKGIKLDAPKFDEIIKVLQKKNIDPAPFVEAINSVSKAISNNPDVRPELKKVSECIKGLESAVKENTKALLSKRSVKYDNLGRVVSIEVVR